MAEQDLKWYSTFVFLVGAILRFADPITDILTLVEFYRADQKTWFYVGLAFVILPCFVFPISILYSGIRRFELYRYSCTRRGAQTLLCAFHPFSAAFARLQGFVYCLKKWWRGDTMQNDSTSRPVNSVVADSLLAHIDNAVLFESVLESIPQFILQLYAMNVQEEPVEVIQLISLPVSFLSLVCAFTTTDQFWNRVAIGDLKLKHKLALFVTNMFLLSSRLFAVCYFTVSYKWWVIGVLLFHCSAIEMFDTIPFCLKGGCEGLIRSEGFRPVIFFSVHWLKDDMSLQCMEEVGLGNGVTILKRMQLLSNVLFVLENFFMILLYYFSQHSNTWYSLPVTVCVCVFSVLGSVMRVVHFRVLLND